MKRMRLLLLVFMVQLLLLFQGTAVLAETQTAPGGSSTAAEQKIPKKKDRHGLYKFKKGYRYYKKGVVLKNKWKTVKGNRYYLDKKGYACIGSAEVKGRLYLFDQDGRLIRPAKDSFVDHRGKTYYITKEGYVSSGWFMVGKKLYFANSKGQLYKNRTYQGVELNKKGAAKKGSTAAKAKIEAQKILQRITTPGMSKAEKLRASWNYLVGGNFYYYVWGDPDITKRGWQQSCALKTLQERRGNCYGFACAFAALANEIGYKPYVIAGRVPGSRDGAADGFTRHCWVSIDGLYYDPEAHFYGWMRNVYANSYYPIANQVQQVRNYRTYI